MQVQKARRLKTGNTAKTRSTLSAPAGHLLRTGRLEGRILDFGCGRGDLAKFLDGDIHQWDPNWHPGRPRGKFDVVVCNYVLNVLPPIVRDHALFDAKSLVRKGGKLYVTVRRDIPRVSSIVKGSRQFYVVPNAHHGMQSIFHKSGKFEIYEWVKK